MIGIRHLVLLTGVVLVQGCLDSYSGELPSETEDLRRRNNPRRDMAHAQGAADMTPQADAPDMAQAGAPDMAGDTSAVPYTCATSWYVDNSISTGTNSGSSWVNAWRSFSNIVWGNSGVKAGDCLFISGGVTSQTYTTTLTVGASGTAGHPITIGVDASSPTHSGNVLFDFSSLGNSTGVSAIDITGKNYVSIDGNVGGLPHLTIQNIVNTGNKDVGRGITNSATATTGVKIRYVSSNHVNNPIFLWRSTGFEIDHNNITHVLGDAAISIVQSSGTWDTNSVHDNYIEETGHYPGPDGIQLGDGVSVFRNTFKRTPATEPLLAPGQHPDGIQVAGINIKIYGNDFQNVGDSVIDVGYSYSGLQDYSNLYIFNNVFRITDVIDPYPEYIRVYGDPGTGKPILSIKNFKIFNNTFIDNNQSYSAILFYNYNGNPTASGIEVRNNLFKNVGIPYRIDASTGFTSGSFAFSDNVYSGGAPSADPAGTVGSPAFVSYTAYSVANDFHLSSTDTLAINRGANLASYFVTDKAGNARPATGAWDIGAYEYP